MPPCIPCDPELSLQNGAPIVASMVGRWGGLNRGSERFKLLPPFGWEQGGGWGGRGHKGNLSSERVRGTVRAYNGVTAGWGCTVGDTDVEPLSSVSVKIGVH